MKKIFCACSLIICILLSSCVGRISSDTVVTSTQNAPVTTVHTETESDTIAAETDTDADVELPDSVRLVMVGDILMHDPVLESGKIVGGYDYHHIFANLADEIASADIAIFNQEVIIAGEKYGIQGYPCFNAPFELADAIAAAGFDVAAHATNHTLDVGKQALLDCLSNWETKHPGIEAVGMHDSQEDADRISVIEKNGIKVAILNYTDIMNLIGLEICEQEPYLVDMLEENRIRKDVNKAQELADFVVVCAHWGTEYTHVPSTTQRKWAEIMLGCGVDLVLGTHPHVIQPVEWLEDSDGNRMLVYWSLGNFINSTGESGTGKGARMLGAMADVSIRRAEDGSVYISDAGAVPLVTHIRYQRGGITTYKFSDYTEEMLLQSEVKNKIDRSFSYAYCEKTFAEVLGDFIKK